MHDPDLRAARRRSLRLRTLLGAATLAAAAGVLAPLPTPAGASGPLPAYATAAANAAAWTEADYGTNGGSYAAGMYADVIFALAATDGDAGVAADALADLEAVTPSYIEPAPGYFNAGGLGKVMLAVQTLDGDVNDFAGYDLEAELRALIVTTGADTGRIGNSSTFSQPLGMMALARTTSGAPSSTGTWLASKQCVDGGFSWGSCSYTDADYTGIAAQALLAVGFTVDADEALDWLEAHQDPIDGGFYASNSPSDSNTNSTGLAVQALRADGRTTPANAGAAYVASVQYTSGPKAGAIPWKAGTDSSLLLATTQGVLAWGAEPFDQLVLD